MRTAQTRRKRRLVALGGGALGGVLILGAILLTVLPRGSRDSVDEMLGEARVAQAEGDYGQAVQGFSRVLDSDPDNVEALEGQLEAAAGLEQAGQLGAAIAAYETVWQARPGEVRALQSLGQAYAAREEWGEAARWYEKWTQVAPEDEGAFLMLSNARLNLGEYEQAVAAYERAEDNGADPSGVDVPLGLAFYEVAQYDKAIKRLQSAIARSSDGDFTDVYYALGGAYFAEQDYEQAIRFYERAKELNPEDKTAWAEGAQGNLDQAYVKNAMQDVLLDLDFSNVAAEGEETYAIARTGQKVEVEGAVHLVDGPWDGSQALVVEEGTTNFVINPSFERGTANWTNDAGSPFTTCAQSSDQARHGAASLHCSSDGASNDAYSASVANVDGGETWTASCWVYLVSGDFRLTIQEKDAGWSDKASAPADTSRRNHWQRVVVTTALTTGGTDGRIKIGPDGAAGSEFYVDSVQFERGGHATTYTDGAQGDGYGWSGAPHASVSRRMASYLQLTGYTHATFSGSVVLWLRPRHDYDEALGRNVVFWRWFAPADVRNDILILKYDSTSKLGFEVWRDGRGVAGAKDTFAYKANEWLHMMLTWNNSDDEMRLYVNGLLHANSTYSSAPNDMGSMLVGAFHDAAKGANAAFAQVATFDRALTAAEVAALYRVGVSASR